MYWTSNAALSQHHRRQKGSEVGGHYGECGARAYNGGLGAEPPAGYRGKARPPEAKSILVIGCPTEPANLAFYHSIRYCVWIYQQQRIYLTENSMLCYGPLVS